MSSITTNALSLHDRTWPSLFTGVAERLRALLADMARGQDAANHYRDLVARGHSLDRAAAEVFALYYAGR